MQSIKRLLPLLLLMCSVPCWATLSIPHQTENSCTAGTTCVVPTTSTTAANIGVAVLVNNNNTTISGVTAGVCAVAWVHCSNCAVFNASTGGVDIDYCTNLTGGTTTLTITSGTTSSPMGAFYELACTATPCSFDVSGNAARTACTSCAMPALTFTGTNDVVITAAGCGATCSGVTGTGWTNDFASPGGDNFSHVINSITMGSITQSSSTVMSIASIAFKESGAAPTKVCTIALMGAGPC